MGFRLLDSNGAARTLLTGLMSNQARRSALAAVAILGCLVPVPAAAYVDYGFNVVDNSAGGSIMENYITQELWADTDLRFMGAQLRIELEEGSIFQDTLSGSSFTFGSPNDALVDMQPSLAFDTIVGVNGDVPGVIAGGAVNLGGAPQIQFDELGLNVAWSLGPRSLRPGYFDLATVSLTKDSVGRGAILLSQSEEMIIHVFEIRDGVIQFADAPVLPIDGQLHLSAEFEESDYMKQLRQRKEDEAKNPAPVPAPPVVPSDPPEATLPPVIEPDPVPQPDPLPEQIENPTEPQLPDPEELIVTPPETVFTPSDPIRWIPLPPVTTRPILIVDGVPTSVEHGEMIGRPVEIDFDLTTWLCGDLEVQWNAKQSDQAMPSSAGVLRSLDGTEIQLLTTAVASNSGDLLVPLSALSDAQRTSLLDTGYWSLQGDYLLYSGTVGVPEPSSIVLVLLAAGIACCWRRRKC